MLQSAIDVSLKTGELSLLPTVVPADALIVADGTSRWCQIHD